MFLFLTTVVENTINRKSFWDLPLQLLYTQVGMAVQWCLEFRWGSGRFLYSVALGTAIYIYFSLLAGGVERESSWNLRKMLTVSFIFILCLLKPITSLVLPFLFHVQHFPKCFTQTCCCLESILPTPKWEAALNSMQGPAAGSSWPCSWHERLHVLHNVVLPLHVRWIAHSGRGCWEVSGGCGLVGGLVGPPPATRSLSKLIKTSQALAYPETQASLLITACTSALSPYIFQL